MGAGVSTPGGSTSNNPMQYVSDDDKKATESDDDKKARLNVNELFKTIDNVDIKPDDFQDFIDVNKLTEITLAEAKETKQSKPVYMVNYKTNGAAHMVGKSDYNQSLTRDDLIYYTTRTTGGRRIRRKTNKNKKTIKKTKSNRKTYRK